jgi:hypothetical protein
MKNFVTFIFQTVHSNYISVRLIEYEYRLVMRIRTRIAGSGSALKRKFGFGSASK